MNRGINELKNRMERMEESVEGSVDECIYPRSSHRCGKQWENRQGYARESQGMEVTQTWMGDKGWKEKGRLSRKTSQKTVKT